MMVTHSPTVWTKAEFIYEDIGKVFAPHFGIYNVKFPVILFVDGHRTLPKYQVGELRFELGITLICLLENCM